MMTAVMVTLSVLVFTDARLLTLPGYLPVAVVHRFYDPQFRQILADSDWLPVLNQVALVIGAGLWTVMAVLTARRRTASCRSWGGSEHTR